ncbi:hypothetical protein [Paenibacillus cymbidii]|uniref:hypothetical protein n=1 Tax=Paenibacillus cymbidii TaxID=1639034 RepID=UPI001081E267|nr:hypothetical protein [Paenibacillus cymbidii]
MKGVIKHSCWIIGLIVGAINLVRGLTHLLTQDSAAGTAGITIDNAGGTDIVYLFAIIGGVQIVLALFYVYVALFRRTLLPLAFAMEGLKTGLNLWIGYAFKPSQAETVVGGSQDTLQLALSVLALLLLALARRRAADARTSRSSGGR